MRFITKLRRKKRDFRFQRILKSDQSIKTAFNSNQFEFISHDKITEKFQKFDWFSILHCISHNSLEISNNSTYKKPKKCISNRKIHSKKSASLFRFVYGEIRLNFPLLFFLQMPVNWIERNVCSPESVIRLIKNSKNPSHFIHLLTTV